MSPIEQRLAALEARKPVILSTCHRIVVEPGERVEDAMAAYGPDRIAPQDRLIVRTIVDSPRVLTSPTRLKFVR